MHIYQAIIDSPIEKLGIKIDNEKLINIDFLPSDTPLIEPEDYLAKEIVAQLKRYFQHSDHIFHLPINPSGTPFQREVWQALQTIPPGNTTSYGVFADKLNTSARAIGNACRSNPIPIVVPCHRVVAAQNIGGYAGARKGKSLEIKKWLLSHEHSL